MLINLNPQSFTYKSIQVYQEILRNKILGDKLITNHIKKDTLKFEHN